MLLWPCSFKLESMITNSIVFLVPSCNFRVSTRKLVTHLYLFATFTLASHFAQLVNLLFIIICCLDGFHNSLFLVLADQRQSVSRLSVATLGRAIRKSVSARFAFRVQAGMLFLRKGNNNNSEKINRKPNQENIHSPPTRLAGSWRQHR